MKLISIPRIIYITFKEHIQYIFTDRFFLINAIINPFGFSLLFYLIYKDQPTKEMLMGLLKAGLLGLWGANIWSSSFILEGEKRLRTIDYLMAAPVPLALILSGKALAKALASITSMFISLFWIQFFVGSIWNYFSLSSIILTIIVSSFAFNAIGLMIGVIFINLQEPDVYGSLFIYPVYILSGIAGGISILPGFMEYISRIIPLYWAHKGFYNILNYHSNYQELVILFMIGLVYLILAIYFLKKVERRAKCSGRFSLY